MGLGFSVSVHRLTADDATRCSVDGLSIVERVRESEIFPGSPVATESYSWARWLFDAVAAGSAFEITNALGFPDTYLIRARDCSLLGNKGLPPNEWVYVKLWDEG